MIESNNSGTVNVLVPCGSLGIGVSVEEVSRGIALGAHVIATDAGSTDSGAAYLALGMSKNTRNAVKRDLQILLRAQATAGIPLLVGSCGQSGSDQGVAWTRDIVVEIARELDMHPKIAVIFSGQNPVVLKQKNASGKIHALAPFGPLDDATLDECCNIVASMGPEPYIKAIEEGADIILGGRTTDTAVIAAVPLWRGVPPEIAWHAGKIAECGAQCTINPGRGKGVFMRLSKAHFEVEPLTEDNRCDPHSVSAHMLYENSDPFRLVEPGGVLDVTEANYAAIDSRAVRVDGARWEPKPYTMKLEGASAGPYQTIMLIGIADPAVLAELDRFHDVLHEGLMSRVEQVMGLKATQFDISLRIYGWNAVSGMPVPKNISAPREVGILCVITAETQELATEIAKACNPYFFHYPLNPGIELPSYGFAFTPADIPRGRVYEFRLNHVVETNDPFELIRMEWVDLRADIKERTVNA